MEIRRLPDDNSGKNLYFSRITYIHFDLSGMILMRVHNLFLWRTNKSFHKFSSINTLIASSAILKTISGFEINSRK